MAQPGVARRREAAAALVDDGERDTGAAAERAL
jgi:hypothetical protein